MIYLLNFTYVQKIKVTRRRNMDNKASNGAYTLFMITEPRFQFKMAVLFNQTILNTEYWILNNANLRQTQVHNVLFDYSDLKTRFSYIWLWYDYSVSEYEGEIRFGCKHDDIWLSKCRPNIMSHMTSNSFSFTGSYSMCIENQTFQWKIRLSTFYNSMILSIIVYKA